MGRPDAGLLDVREVLPGRWLQTWEAPALATATQPGQYVHAVPAGRAVAGHGPGGLLEAWPVSSYDRLRGLIRLHVDVGTDGRRSGLAQLRAGDRARLTGPLGRGFLVDPRSLHLLLVADLAGLPRIEALAHEGLATGRRVVLLLEATSARSVYPSSLLADEVEYVVATADGSLGHRGSASDLVPGYEAWADQCFGAGSEDLMARLAMLARGRDQRMGVARLGRRPGRHVAASDRARARRRAWLQLALEHPMGCALATCLGCVTPGPKGPLRVCREGPVFAAEDLVELGRPA